MVQNQFLETLLETGIVGVGLFAALLVGFFIVTRRQRSVWAVAVAFLVQWFFFSGYPNTLHVFMILALLYAFSITARQKR